MDLEQLLARRLIIQTGKGGTGRTTISAALAVIAARRGRRTLLVEIDTPDRFSALFGLRSPVGYEVTPLRDGVWGLNLDPDEVVVDFFRTHVKVAPIYRQILRSRIWRTFYEAGPGLRELICLGKIWRLLGERDRGKPRWDCVVVDAPATGHGIAILNMGRVAHETLLGPMKKHAGEIRELLQDPARTVVNILAIPEEMPVSEAGDLYRALAEELELPLGLCIANAVLPPLSPPSFCARFPELLEADREFREAIDQVLADHGLGVDALLGAASWRCARAAMETELLVALKERVPLPNVAVPYVHEAASFGPESLEAVADALERALNGLEQSAARRD